MKKIQDERLEKGLERLKKTYPELKLISHLEYARLIHPNDYPYEHQHRLQRNISNEMIQMLYDFNQIFYNLDKSYQLKVLQNENMIRLLDKLLKNMDKINRKNMINDYEKDSMFVLFNNLFTIGIEGLIKTMPDEFQGYLIGQIKPLFQLMQSIAKFANSTKKYNIPSIKEPECLVNSSIPGIGL